MTGIHPYGPTHITNRHVLCSRHLKRGGRCLPTSGRTLRRWSATGSAAARANCHPTPFACHAAQVSARRCGSGWLGSSARLQLSPLLPFAACAHQSYFQAVWSSIAQTHGVTQGVHFDTATLTPLINSVGGLEAFRIFAEMKMSAAPEEPDEPCARGSLTFARGRCALTLGSYVSQVRVSGRPPHRRGVGMRVIAG